MLGNIYLPFHQYRQMWYNILLEILAISLQSIEHAICVLGFRAAHLQVVERSRRERERTENGRLVEVFGGSIILRIVLGDHASQIYSSLQ